MGGVPGGGGGGSGMMLISTTGSWSLQAESVVLVATGFVCSVLSYWDMWRWLLGGDPFDAAFDPEPRGPMVLDWDSMCPREWIV